MFLKPALRAAEDDDDDDDDVGDIHYVHSGLIEYSSCAYMGSCRVLPSFQGLVTPLVLTRGLMLKRYFLCLLVSVSSCLCFIIFFMASSAPLVNCKLCVL